MDFTKEILMQADSQMADICMREGTEDKAADIVPSIRKNGGYVANNILAAALQAGIHTEKTSAF